MFGGTEHVRFSRHLMRDRVATAWNETAPAFEDRKDLHDYLGARADELSERISVFLHGIDLCDGTWNSCFSHAMLAKKSWKLSGCQGALETEAGAILNEMNSIRRWLGMDFVPLR